MNVFIREAPIEKNIASECIRTVAETYNCEILQLCEYDANVYRCELRMKPQEYQFMQHKGQLITGMRSFFNSLNSTCFKILKIAINILFFMKIRPLIGRRIRIGRRLHMNQPLHPCRER